MNATLETAETAATAEPRIRVRTGLIDGVMAGNIRVKLPEDWCERCDATARDIVHAAGGTLDTPEMPEGAEAAALIERLQQQQYADLEGLRDIILARLPAIRTRRHVLRTLTGEDPGPHVLRSLTVETSEPADA
jgi:hypothetical protein